MIKHVNLKPKITFIWFDFWKNNKQIPLKGPETFPLAPSMKTNKSLLFIVRKAIGDSFPNCSMGEIPPSSFKPTMDQRLLSLEQMLKDQ